MFLFFISFFVIGDIVAWVFSARWARTYIRRRWFSGLLHAFFALQTAYILILVALIFVTRSRHVFDQIPAPIQAFFYVWHFIVLPIALLLWAAIGTAIAGYRLGRRIRPEPAVPEPAPVGPPIDQLSRRSLLIGSIAAIPPALSLGASAYGLAQVSSFRIRRMMLPVANLPPGLDGLRIAHVSDLHVGRWSTRDFLDEVVATTNSLNADIVAFTGDLIDIAIDDLPLAIDTYRRFRSRHGSFMVEGNHDLIDDPGTFRNVARQEELRLLLNETFTVDHEGTPLQILGIPWSRSDAATKLHVDLMATRRDGAAFPLLLAHHPHAFDAAAAVGFPLTLAGHTHGGLIALTRDVTAGSLMFRYTSGLYTRGDCKLLVSNGTGNWFPLRINAPAEILDVTLRRAAGS